MRNYVDISMQTIEGSARSSLYVKNDVEDIELLVDYMYNLPTTEIVDKSIKYLQRGPGTKLIQADRYNTDTYTQLMEVAGMGVDLKHMIAMFGHGNKGKLETIMNRFIENSELYWDCPNKKRLIQSMSNVPDIYFYDERYSSLLYKYDMPSQVIEALDNGIDFNFLSKHWETETIFDYLDTCEGMGLEYGSGWNYNLFSSVKSRPYSQMYNYLFWDLLFKIKLGGTNADKVVTRTTDTIKLYENYMKHKYGYDTNKYSSDSSLILQEALLISGVSNHNTQRISKELKYRELLGVNSTSNHQKIYAQFINKILNTSDLDKYVALLVDTASIVQFIQEQQEEHGGKCSSLIGASLLIDSSPNY